MLSFYLPLPSKSLEPRIGSKRWEATRRSWQLGECAPLPGEAAGTSIWWSVRLVTGWHSPVIDLAKEQLHTELNKKSTCVVNTTGDQRKRCVALYSPAAGPDLLACRWRGVSRLWLTGAAMWKNLCRNGSDISQTQSGRVEAANGGRILVPRHSAN